MTTPSDVAQLVDDEGGRFSVELGLDLDHRPRDVERWFLAATLFGSPVRTSTAMTTWRVLDGAGVRSVADAGAHDRDALVALLDAGGYARYDFRTATRLHTLAEHVDEHHGGCIGTLAAETDPRHLAATLDRLPGWGPATVHIFLRELRGVWPGARPSVDERAVDAARRIRLPLGRAGPGRWDRLAAHAQSAGRDPRDLEAALVRRALRTRPAQRSSR